MSNSIRHVALQQYREQPRDLQDSDDQSSNLGDAGSMNESDADRAPDTKYQRGHPLADEGDVDMTAPSRHVSTPSGSQPSQKRPGASKVRSEDLLSDLLQHQHRFKVDGVPTQPPSDAEILQSAPIGQQFTANPRPLPQFSLPPSIGQPPPGPQSSSLAASTSDSQSNDLQAAPIGQHVTAHPQSLPQFSLPPSFGNPASASPSNLTSAPVGQVFSSLGNTSMHAGGRRMSEVEPTGLQSAPTGHQFVANPQPMPQISLPPSIGQAPPVHPLSVAATGVPPQNLQAASIGQHITANPRRRPLPTLPLSYGAPHQPSLATLPTGEVLSVLGSSSTPTPTDLRTLLPGQQISVQPADRNQLSLAVVGLRVPHQRKPRVSLRDVPPGGRVVRRCNDDMQVDGESSSSDGTEGDDESDGPGPGRRHPRGDKAKLREALRNISIHRENMSKAGKNHDEIAAAVDVLTRALERSMEAGAAMDARGAGTGGKRKKKINDHPVRRCKRSRRLANYLRAAVVELLKMPGKKPRIPDGPPENVSYPTVRDFYFEWSEGMSSPWNQRSLAIVYKYLMTKHEDEAEGMINFFGVTKIEKKIKKHAEYLKRLWMKQHHFTERDLELYNLAHSNYTRRRALFLRRLATCERHPAFHKHVKLYKSLGAAGTSSDEEGLTDSEDPGPQGHSKVFFVKKIPYLSTALTELNEEVDAESELYARRTFMRGSLPRRRIRGDLVSESSRVVFYLAENVYDDDWLRDLDDFERDRVEPEPDLHPF